jgi:hypothetical protein
MPNTLMHLGAQGLVSKAVFRDADVKWIYLGAVIPDIPWIFSRAFQPLMSGPAVYDLILYAAIQSSLIFCLVLSAALSSLSSRPWRVLTILAFGSLLHLLLDACQTKWGNGVILLAPFSWDLLNFGLFWPESAITMVATGSGAVFFIYAWFRFPVTVSSLAVPSGRAALVFAGAILVFFLLPLVFMPTVKETGIRSVSTLQTPSQRAGKSVMFDRVPNIRRAGQDYIRTASGEELRVVGVGHVGDGHVSIKGYFVDQKSVVVEALHISSAAVRDYASYLGLVLVVFAWGRSIRIRKTGAR